MLAEEGTSFFLEFQLAEGNHQYRAREDYFGSILASQRWTFGTVVGVFAALVGLVGFGVFKRYVTRVEDTQEEMEERVDALTTELKSELSGLSERQELILERIRVLERRQETSGQSAIESAVMGEYPSTFIELATDVLDKLPTTEERIMEKSVYPSLDIMRIGLNNITHVYSSMPIELKEKGIPLLREIETQLEGWEKEQDMVRYMIQTIEKG